MHLGIEIYMIDDGTNILFQNWIKKLKNEYSVMDRENFILGMVVNVFCYIYTDEWRIKHGKLIRLKG